MWQVRLIGLLVIVTLVGTLFYRYENNIKKSVINEVKIESLEQSNKSLGEELDKQVETQVATNEVVKEDITKKQDIDTKVETKKQDYRAIFDSIAKKHEVSIKGRQKSLDNDPVFVEREELDTARIDGLWETFCTVNPTDKECLPVPEKEKTDE